MKIGKKELSLLLVVLGIIFVVGAVLFGNSLASKTETLTAENDTLSKEVEYLQDLKDHEQEYRDEADRMNMEMEDIKDQFPAGIRPETQVMYANGLESSYEILLDGIDMPGIDLVTVDSGVTPEAQAPATDTGLDEEGTTEVAPEQDTAALASAATSISLYKAPMKLSYHASYRGIKDVIRYISEDRDRKSIEGFTLSLDSTTGNLQGEIDVNMYALDGTGKEYEAPIVTGVTDGKTQIINGGTTLNRSGANLAGDAATADGKAQPTDNAEADENRKKIGDEI